MGPTLLGTRALGSMRPARLGWTTSGIVLACEFEWVFFTLVLGVEQGLPNTPGSAGEAWLLLLS